MSESVEIVLSEQQQSEIDERITRIFSKERINGFEIPQGFKIRLVRESDADAHYQGVQKNMAYLVQWISLMKDYKTVEDSRNYLKFMEECHVTMKKLVFAIIDGDKFIGSVLFRDINFIKSQGEIGYWLDEDYQNRGIIFECVKQILKIGFEFYELNEILISCMADNAKSANIAMKFNFTEVTQTYPAELSTPGWRYFTLAKHVAK